MEIVLAGDGEAGADVAEDVLLDRDVGDAAPGRGPVLIPRRHQDREADLRVGPDVLEDVAADEDARRRS